MGDWDAYQISAEFYDDAYANAPSLNDLPFYLDLARQIGGPILEMGCGTGRVLRPIARAGIEIHGLDCSLAMLQILRRHLAREAVDVQQRIVIYEGDMRTFRGKQKYPLVTIPFRPLQHLYNVNDQVAALKTATFHLNEQGILALDVFFPNYALLDRIGEEGLEMAWPDMEHPGRVIRRYYRIDSVDRVRQVVTITFTFRVYEDEEPIGETVSTMQMSYYTYPHLKALFLLAGLAVVEEYGSFAKEPLDDGAGDMVFVLKRV